MNVQQLRHALKIKWLLYYRQNRPWLTKIRIWGTYEGIRRPSSGFILATLTYLEPKLIEMLPFIISLSNNPDQIVVALGLSFNPEEELKLLTEAPSIVVATNGNVSATELGKANTNGNVSATELVKANTNGNVSGQPKIKSEINSSGVTGVTNLTSWVDETCQGVGWNQNE